ncbi:MAG: metallophosphoesterase [Candidatus Bathyarchaeia archaeon]|jgi:uncharacterized coiled-coil protein SlyX
MSKKSVSRKLVLGIAVLCIVTVIAVGGLLQNLSVSQTRASSQNKTIDSLNAQIADLTAQVSSMKANNTDLQNKLNSEVEKYNSLKATETVTSTTLLKTQYELAAAQDSLASTTSALQSEQSIAAADNTEIATLNGNVASMQAQSDLPTENPIGVSFSIVQITDTQYLSDSYPAAYSGLTSWIVNNSEALNLAMVVHTGDIVETPNNLTDWQNANAAMMTLYYNEIPYCWDAGNHDQIGNDGYSDGNVNGTYIGGNYPAFNVTLMRQNPYWVGDIFNGASTAVQFSFGSYRFMIINVEYDANQTVLNWMQGLLAANPNVNVIVATHNYLNGNGTYGTLDAYDVTWATNFEKILNNYPNVFMTLNGHDYGEGGTADNLRVGNREEIFFNRQEVDNQMGAATARIYTFNFNDTANPIVYIHTYQDYGSPHFLTDPQDQFTFYPALNAYSPSNATVPTSNSFLGSSGYSVGFGSAATLQGFSQYGDTLTFNGLIMNGVTSNFTVTSVGSNIVINSINATQIKYTVLGTGGYQMFSAASAPKSVQFNGSPAAPTNWTYSATMITTTGWGETSMGEVTVTGAPSGTQVTLNF